jgi:heme exporter protein A
MPPLKVQQLAVVRGDRTIVAGLGFTLGAGEVLHLEGRNGAGKTSVLEVLAGLRRADEGRIEGQPDAQARHWLGHKNGLNAALTPIENLEFWAGLNGLRIEAPKTVLASVGLKAQAQRLCGQLSTGQRRRAALARLVAVPRPWWFLDEPLAGLDAEGLEIFAAMLAGHLAGGGAAVVTSHQPLPGDLPGLRSLRLGA